MLDCIDNPVALARRNRLEVRQGWSFLLSRVEWDYFITLTYDPKRYPRAGEESWLSSWRWFLFAWLKACALQAGAATEDPGDGRLRGSWANAWRHGRGRPWWALALEPHRDDRLHAHVLLKLTRDLPWLDWRIGQDLWWKNRGLCKFEVPRDQNHVAAYVSKYILKSGSDSVTLSDNFDAPMMADAPASSTPVDDGILGAVVLSSPGDPLARE